MIAFLLSCTKRKKRKAHDMHYYSDNSRRNGGKFSIIELNYNLYIFNFAIINSMLVWLITQVLAIIAADNTKTGTTLVELLIT